ncbi:hypothetical protein VTO42DRAFT_8364 [Malbranchea cinnamomea]
MKNVWGKCWGLTFRRVGGCRQITRRSWSSSALGTTAHQFNDSSSDSPSHIQAGLHETVLFIENVLPVNLGWLPRIPYLNPNRTSEPVTDIHTISSTSALNFVKRAVPVELRPRISQIIPRYGEGGAFIKISHEPGNSPPAKEIAHQVNKYLSENPIRPWFCNFRAARAGLVRGRPWIEDLYRFPSSRLKVEYLPTSPGESAVELTQEALYTLARPYGKLGDIVTQPSDSKVLPRYALLDFARPGHAVMAKNCLHGLIIPETQGGGKSGTLLKLTYEPKIKAHWIRDWIFNHPRIVVPVLAAIVAGITVVIFDPIRTLFIKLRIAPPLSLEDNKIWQWVQEQASRANDMFSFRHKRSDSTGLTAIWEDRQEDIERIHNWLVESSDTVIVVQGPRGSGKRELVVDGVLRDYKHKLVIDCKPIQEAHGDSAVIAAAAAEVGYRPVFSWMNNISSLIDVASQSAIGTKAGLSQTLDTQLGHIWQNTANALKQVALEGRKSDDKHAHMTNDEYLEAHPECRPVVVIDNFLHKSNDNQMIYDKLASWAAALTYSHIARVIFLTTDSGYSKVLSRALPNQMFHQVSLGDCAPDVAKRYVREHLRTHYDTQEVKDSEDEYISELDECIETLGGRLTDLDFLVQMMARGERPKDAVRQIIDQSAAEILKVFLVDANSPSRSWSVEQAWYLITKLGSANDGTVRYGEVMLSDIFKKSGEDAIRDLEQAELISITTLNGRPSQIKPGKPVYYAGFKKLIADEVLRSRLDVRILSQLTSMENANITKYEEELRILGSLPKPPSEAEPRAKWLLSKLVSSQQKVEKYEKEMSRLKEILRKSD